MLATLLQNQQAQEEHVKALETVDFQNASAKTWDSVRLHFHSSSFHSFNHYWFNLVRSNETVQWLNKFRSMLTIFPLTSHLEQQRWSDNNTRQWQYTRQYTRIRKYNKCSSERATATATAFKRYIGSSWWTRQVRLNFISKQWMCSIPSNRNCTSSLSLFREKKKKKKKKKSEAQTNQSWIANCILCLFTIVYQKFYVHKNWLSVENRHRTSNCSN